MWSCLAFSEPYSKDGQTILLLLLRGEGGAPPAPQAAPTALAGRLVLPAAPVLTPSHFTLQLAALQLELAALQARQAGGDGGDGDGGDSAAGASGDGGVCWW